MVASFLLHSWGLLAQAQRRSSTHRDSLRCLGTLGHERVVDQKVVKAKAMLQIFGQEL